MASQARSIFNPSVGKMFLNCTGLFSTDLYGSQTILTQLITK